jgi:hypothetical protein
MGGVHRLKRMNSKPLESVMKPKNVTDQTTPEIAGATRRDVIRGAALAISAGASATLFDRGALAASSNPSGDLTEIGAEDAAGRRHHDGKNSHVRSNYRRKFLAILPNAAQSIRSVSVYGGAPAPVSARLLVDVSHLRVLERIRLDPYAGRRHGAALPD